jgi:hypothetical protein
MEKIKNSDIHFYNHKVDGFTLSYITDDNKYFKKRYIGYGIREAKKRFKLFITNSEVSK